MRASAGFLFAVAATLIAAQNFSGEPSCALQCLPAAISAAGCAMDDQGCQCGPSGQAAIQSAGTNCLLSACDAAELASAFKIGTDLCKAYSSTMGLTSPSSTPASTTAPGPASTSFSSSTTISSPSTVSSTATSTSGSVTGASVSVSTTKAPTTTSAASVAASSSSSKGGSGHMEIGGVIGLVLGAVGWLL